MSVPFIVLVDPDETLTAHLSQELRPHGFRIQTFVSIDPLFGGQVPVPDLLVLCVDPKKTGWTLCNKIRKDAALQAAFLVVTSAEATEKDFSDHRRLKTRADDYLHKPYSSDQLLEKITGFFELPNAIDEREIDADEEVESADDLVESAEIDETSPMNLFDLTGEDSGARPFDNSPSTEPRGEALLADDNPRDAETLVSTLEPPRVKKASIGEAVTMELPAADYVDQIEKEVELASRPGGNNVNDFDLSTIEDALDAVSTPVAVTSIIEAEPAGTTEPATNGDVPATASAASDDTQGYETEKFEAPETTTTERPPEVVEGQGGSSREKAFLNLRELIQKREKEIATLREQLGRQENELVQRRDRTLELESRIHQLEEKLAQTERERSTHMERSGVLERDKDLAGEREKQLKGRLEETTQQLKRREQELEALEKKFHTETTTLQAELVQNAEAHRTEIDEAAARAEIGETQLRDRYEQKLRSTLADLTHTKALEQEAALEQQRTEYEATLQEKEQAYSDEILNWQTRYSQDIKLAERKHAEELSRLREQHVRELQISEERRMIENEQKAEEHRIEIEQLNQENEREREQLEKAHEAAVHQLETHHAQLIQKARSDHQRELAATVETWENKLAQELQTAKDNHLRKIQLMEESHAELKAAQQDRQAKQLEELKNRHQSAIEEHESRLEDVHALLSAQESQTRELEQSLKTERESGRKLEFQLREAHGSLDVVRHQLSERDARLSERAERISELEQESANFQEQILRAYQKIQTDEATASQAKKALAIALTLLDEKTPDSP